MFRERYSPPEKSLEKLDSRPELRQEYLPG
jgi:hypothetical protein